MDFLFKPEKRRYALRVSNTSRGKVYQPVSPSETREDSAVDRGHGTHVLLETSSAGTLPPLDTPKDQAQDQGQGFTLSAPRQLVPCNLTWSL